MDEKDRLQSNLALVRSCAGWTAATLGDKIGLKRQTISTLEQNKEKYRMTKVQYLAIRKVLDDEIASSKEETKMLAIVLDALVDHPENYEPNQLTAILDQAKLLAPALVKQPQKRKAAFMNWKTILVASGVAVAGTMLYALLHRDD